MKPFLVVIPHINVHILLNILTRKLGQFKDPSVLKVTEETLNNIPVSASPNVSHTLPDTIAPEQFTKSRTSALSPRSP